MNPLFILLQTSELTEGAARMQVTDPHGWTLALIAVTVVFTALVILFVAFSIVGKVSLSMEARKNAPAAARKPRRKSGKAPDEETAAAIALALSAEAGDEVPAAIAAALSLYLGCGVHDSEPYIITIRRTPSAWDSPANSFRKNPVK